MSALLCPECNFVAARECALGSHRYWKHGVPGKTYPPVCRTCRGSGIGFIVRIGDQHFIPCAGCDGTGIDRDLAAPHGSQVAAPEEDILGPSGATS